MPFFFKNNLTEKEMFHQKNPTEKGGKDE